MPCPESLLVAMVAAIEAGETQKLKALLAEHKGATELLNTPVNGAATLLTMAAGRGQVAALESLLAKDADIDLTDADGSPPITVAAAAGHLDCVRLLLCRGADANLPDRKTGATALMVLDLNDVKHIEGTKLLLSFGADPAAAANDGSTPISVAERRGNGKSAVLLADAAATAGVSWGPFLNTRTVIEMVGVVTAPLLLWLLMISVLVVKIWTKLASLVRR